MKGEAGNMRVLVADDYRLESNVVKVEDPPSSWRSYLLDLAIPL
jgi:hypothetical protein